jgi:hypothetical protein
MIACVPQQFALIAATICPGAGAHAAPWLAHQRPAPAFRSASTQDLRFDVSVEIVGLQAMG